jgi:acetyl esterase
VTGSTTARLDPDAQALLEVARAIDAAPLHTLAVEEARARMRAILVTSHTAVDLPHVEDIHLLVPSGPLRLRLYRPTAGALPLALFVHGGGWTINDLDTHDDLCRRLAKRSGCLLASLDFRRAPEYKHPAALDDAYLAYRWLLDNAKRIECHPECRAVAGESSGATTVTALALLLRNTGAPMPAYQVLAYPLTDRFGRWASYAQRGSGYVLDRDLLRWFFMHSGLPVDGGPDDHNVPVEYAFPLLAEDLSGLPPSLVMTAEFDPLRDEGVAYADRLAEAGVAVEHIHAHDQMHGFLLQRRAVPKAGQLIDRFADALARGPQERADRA